MSFVTLLAALLLGHYRPLPQADLPRTLFTPYAKWLERTFNDGQVRHGVIAWLLAVLLPVLVVGVAYLVLDAFNPLIGLVFAVSVLYLVLRMRDFGTTPEQIAARLRDHNLDEARDLLAAWQGCESQDYDATQVAKVSIEATLRHAHHDLFAPIFWFVLLGPAGALLYRLACLLSKVWDGQDAFSQVARHCFEWLDWMPVRVTAASFAVVGDFEDAVYCWRTQASAWPNQATGIILASGAGALGVRLGDPLPNKGVLEYRPELGMGDEADADYLQSATGLVWRVLALMVGLLLLLTFAHWLGS